MVAGSRHHALREVPSLRLSDGAALGWRATGRSRPPLPLPDGSSDGAAPGRVDLALPFLSPMTVVPDMALGRRADQPPPPSFGGTRGSGSTTSPSSGGAQPASPILPPPQLVRSSGRPDPFGATSGATGVTIPKAMYFRPKNLVANVSKFG